MSDLQRFVDAQGRVIARVRDELKAGEKKSHWMWFIFPQIAGLGRSETARRFAIASLDEAKAYAGHPVLGPRLRECTALVLGARGRNAQAIFGHPDDLKFRSCMTLFARATGDPLFVKALENFFGGEEDTETVKRI
jgi:uncharacterized protein (DUF1810 family)